MHARPMFGRIFVALVALTACSKHEQHLTVFAAASMVTSLDALKRVFVDENPGWDIRTEISGSRIACRKVIDEGRAADLVIVADRELIEQLLVPEYASFTEVFAANALVLAWYPGSRVDALLADGATAWQTVAMRDDLRIGIADPTQAPVGYRALMALTLNDKVAGEPLRVGAAIARRVDANPKPDDVAKLALALETGSLDLAFVYASDAEQRHLKYRRLDARIDFSDPTKRDWYATEQYTIAGTVIHGSPATYALTIPKNAPHPDMAALFARLMVSPRGHEAMGLAHLIPFDAPEVSGAPPATLR